MANNPGIAGGRRKGVAPVELAVILPLIIITGLMILYVARVSIVSVGGASASRRDGWRLRSTVAQPNPLKVATDPVESRTGATVTKTHPQWRGLSGALPANLKSSFTTRVIAGTWDPTVVTGWAGTPAYWAPHNAIALQTGVVTQTMLDTFSTTNTNKLNPTIAGGSLAVQTGLNDASIVLGTTTGGSNVSGARNLLSTLSVVTNRLYLATIGRER